MKNFLLLFSLFFMVMVSFSGCSEAGLDADLAAETDKKFAEARQIFQNFCSTCHGERMEAFADRRWKKGKTKEALFHSISKGDSIGDMPAWEMVLTDRQIKGLVEYIQYGIERVEKYGFQDEVLESDTFRTPSLNFTLDTVVYGLKVPWGMTFLPEGDMLVTERSGVLYRVDPWGIKVKIKGVPTVLARRQGGLLDVKLHPDFEANQWVYLSYSGIKEEQGDTLATTLVDRYTLDGNSLTQRKQILEALPYSNKFIHYGSRMEFGTDGYLYISVGDRSNRDVNPQSLEVYPGKVHRVKDDGGIPEDNPFANDSKAVKSIFAYGSRNIQGMDLNPRTGEIWTHEHGPRGGDEINIIKPGLNYGWPVISYGINYDGTKFTSKLEQAGMEQPLHFWVPSIAPSGMAFVSGDKYGGWEGDLLVGSLRFKYLNRCIIEDNKVVEEEILIKNIGRVRDVRMGPDGFIYVAVENPGFVFRLVPFE